MKHKIMMIAALLCLVTAVARAQEGAWSGELDIQGIKLPLVFHFNPDGCTMDSPSQGAKGIKAEKCITADGKLKVTVAECGVTFEGYMWKNSIIGTFSQNGLSLPLTIKPGMPKVNRPQTPVAPFPYTTEEVSFKNGTFTLCGTLTLPQSYSKNTPVVLMVTGSGQQNRDEECFDHKPFAAIADALARQGIASLRYDDRGYNDPSVTFTDFTTDDFKDDAAAGIAFLRNRFKTVGVLGHSEGGTIALMLAGEGKPDFIVSMAGMVISGKETLLGQNRTVLRSMGLSDDAVNDYCKVISNIFDKVAAGMNIDEVLHGYDDSSSLKPLISQAKQTLSVPYMRHLITVDVRKSLPKIKCPVLAVNGKLDMQVDYEANLGALEKGLVNARHETVAFDSLNHLFQHCTTGSVVEYQQIEETMSKDVLDKIASWINSLEQ